MYNRLKSMIYGVAVGDALGVPYEFCSRSEMKEEPCKDMIGYGVYDQPAGSWSDDTSLTLCLLDAIDYNKQVIDFDIAKQNCIDWCFQERFTANNVRFDIGNTTFQAIKRMSNGVNLFNCGSKEDTHNGNGSLMRISPLVPLLVNIKEIENRFQLIEKVSCMTHGHVISIVGCHIYCEIMMNLWNGMEKFKAISNAIKKLKEFYEDKNEIPYDISYREAFYKYERIFSDDFASLSNKHILSHGYVLVTLEASLWCFLNGKDYEDIVLMAVNLGKDTDTTAAIAGSMAGLYYGIENIPEDWICTILNKDLIERIIEKVTGED